jgi:hypothetical protein
VLLIPVINYRQCRCYRLLIIAGVVVTGDKLVAGVMDTGNKHKVVNISANFNKNLKSLPVGNLRTRGEMNHEKT